MNLEAFKALEDKFSRAPSAHNTQPWSLQYLPDKVQLYYEPSRALPISDPTKRDLFLSLGAFVETVLIVCADAGMKVNFVPKIQLENAYIGEFVEAAEIYQTEFRLADVVKRQSSRLSYQAGTDAPKLEMPANVRLDECRAMEVYDLYRISDKQMYEDVAVSSELYQWLRFDKKDARYYQDGLNAECLALSPIEARFLNFVLRPERMRFFRKSPILSLILHFSAEILKDKSLVWVLSSRYRGFEDLLQLGRSLQKIWLGLARAGYYTHPLSQIIDCEESYGALAKQLELNEGEKVFSIFRVGKSEKPVYSPRR